MIPTHNEKPIISADCGSFLPNTSTSAPGMKLTILYAPQHKLTRPNKPQDSIPTVRTIPVVLLSIKTSKEFLVYSTDTSGKIKAPDLLVNIPR
jgi:hypothetical protein